MPSFIIFGLTWKGKEDPGSKLTGLLETAEIELADGHGECVFQGSERIPEVGEIGRQHEVEEATEGAKDDDELDDEGGQTNKAEFDRCSNLTEGLLETGKKKSWGNYV